MSIEQRPTHEPTPCGVSLRNQPQSPSLGAQPAMRPAVFVMGDCLICEEQPGRVPTSEAPHFAAGALEALRILARLDMPIILLMDQGGAWQGEFTRQAPTWLRERLIDEITAQGGRCDALFICTLKPHGQHGQHETCTYSMPHTDTLKQAAQMFTLDLTRSAFICDTWEQACAALSLRCQPLLTLTTRGRAEVLYPMWAEVRERAWYAADVVGAAQSIEATVLGQRLWRELHTAQTGVFARQHSTMNSTLRAGL